MVTKQQLLDLVWPGSFVEEGILAVHISALRKALGERQSGRRFIETVSRTGYRFVAAVRQLEANHRTPEKAWTVAVLPGRPLISELFSGGERATGLALADALIGRLGSFKEIIVRPTRAVQAYVDSAEDPAALGRRLRVDAVIATHFAAAADRIRISVELIRCDDGTRLWSGEFDESATDLIAIANPVAESVIARLRPGSQYQGTSTGTRQLAGHPKV